MHLAREAFNPCEIGTQLCHLVAQLDLQCTNGFLALLHARVGAFRQCLAALNRASDMFPLFIGIPTQRPDLFDHLHDFALGFSQGISDLAMHHVDVKSSVQHIGLNCLSARQQFRNLLEVQLAESPHLRNSSTRFVPIPPFDRQSRYHQKHHRVQREDVRWGANAAPIVRDTTSRNSPIRTKRSMASTTRRFLMRRSRISRFGPAPALSRIAPFGRGAESSWLALLVVDPIASTLPATLS